MYIRFPDVSQTEHQAGTLSPKICHDSQHPERKGRSTCKESAVVFISIQGGGLSYDALILFALCPGGRRLSGSSIAPRRT